MLSAYLKQTSSNLTSYGDSTSFKNATKVGTEKKTTYVFKNIQMKTGKKYTQFFFSIKQAGFNMGFFKNHNESTSYFPSFIFYLQKGSG